MDASPAFMNRRHFFKTLAVAAAGFSILPAATTYERVWRVQRKPMWVPNPAYLTAPFENAFLFAEQILCFDENAMTEALHPIYL